MGLSYLYDKIKIIQIINYNLKMNNFFQNEYINNLNNFNNFNNLNNLNNFNSFNNLNNFNKKI